MAITNELEEYRKRRIAELNNAKPLETGVGTLMAGNIGGAAADVGRQALRTIPGYGQALENATRADYSRGVKGIIGDVSDVGAKAILGSGDVARAVWEGQGAGWQSPQSPSLAVKSPVTVPSAQVASPLGQMYADAANPAYMSTTAPAAANPYLQKGFSQGLKSGEMRYYDPKTGKAVSEQTDTSYGQWKTKMQEAQDPRFKPVWNAPKQSMADLQKQSEIAQRDYKAWQERIAAQPAYKMQAGPTIAPKSEREAMANRKMQGEIVAGRQKFAGEQAQAERQNALEIEREKSKSALAKAQAESGNGKSQMTLGDMSEYRRSLVEEQQQFAPGKDGKWASEKQQFEYDKRQRLIDELDVEAQRRIAGGERPATAQTGQAPAGQAASAPISVESAREQAKAAGKKQFKLGGKIYDV